VLKRWLLYTGSVVAGLAVVGALLGAFVLALLWPTLPPLDALTDYQPKIPLRVVSADGDLLGEFGEERRAVIRISEVPDVMKHAILAAEDERFYQHGGVDYLSILRAALSNVTSGTQQGAGTITMQVARNFFLTREKTVSRKLREVLLAWKIEASLPKDEILELYINQIFLGQRAYGFAAAAQIYFGKPLADVTVAEAAMLAGLPKAPSAYNPVSNPRRAKTRQLYVLRRMHELGYVNDDQWRKAQTEPLTTRVLLREPLSVHAEFVAEMARQVVYDAYGDDAYTRGITVWTTIRRADQDAAYNAVRRGVTEYDRRHGYRGPEAYVNLPEDAAEAEAALERAFQDATDSDNLVAAVVTAASAAEVRAVLSNGDTVRVDGEGLKFAARSLSDKAPVNQRLRRGVRRQFAPFRDHRLRQAELPQQLSDGRSAEPGGERKLQPARQPGVGRHAGGELRASDARGLWLGRLNHIQRADRPRDVHDQRVGYPVEDAKHKRQSGALVGQLDAGIRCIRRLGDIANSAAEVVEREHVADLDLVGAAAVDADDRVGTGFPDLAKPPVDRYHATADLRVGRMWRIGNGLRFARGD